MSRSASAFPEPPRPPSRAPAAERPKISSPNSCARKLLIFLKHRGKMLGKICLPVRTAAENRQLSQTGNARLPRSPCHPSFSRPRFDARGWRCCAVRPPSTGAAQPTMNEASSRNSAPLTPASPVTRIDLPSKRPVTGEPRGLREPKAQAAAAKAATASAASGFSSSTRWPAPLNSATRALGSAFRQRSACCGGTSRSSSPHTMRLGTSMRWR